jgi:hypothetical protein
MNRFLPILSIAACLLLPMAGHSQSTSEEIPGWSASVHVAGSLIGMEDVAESDAGYGAGFEVRRGLSPRWSAFGGIDRFSKASGDYHLMQFDLGLFYDREPDAQASSRTYFLGGLALWRADLDRDGEGRMRWGPGAMMGGGYLRGLTQTTGLDVGLRLGMGALGRLPTEVNPDPDSSEHGWSVRLRIGVTRAF